MRIFSAGKDGGPESTVTGFWLVELKKLFSIAVLRFGNGSRENFHSHAFNSISWVLRGKLREEHLGGEIIEHTPSILPVLTVRSTFHRVFSEGTTWVITFRGPWDEQWYEYNSKTGKTTTLRNGRIVVEET